MRIELLNRRSKAGLEVGDQWTTVMRRGYSGKPKSRRNSVVLTTRPAFTSASPSSMSARTSSR